MTNVIKFATLVAEHQDLPVITLVATDVVCGDEYSYWQGSIGTSFIGEAALLNGAIYIDRKAYKDALEREITDEELDKQFFTAIILFIELPEIHIKE